MVLKAGETLSFYSAVMGAADDPRYLSDSFYEYINSIRVRPLRFQTQYNYWFDYKGGVSKEAFQASVEKINQELCLERGVKPLKAYVIDDGWQDSRKLADWSKKVWTLNHKFSPDFKSL